MQWPVVGDDNDLNEEGLRMLVWRTWINGQKY